MQVWFLCSTLFRVHIVCVYLSLCDHNHTSVCTASLSSQGTFDLLVWGVCQALVLKGTSECMCVELWLASGMP